MTTEETRVWTRPAVPAPPEQVSGWPIVGPYRVERLLGSGGYGTVYVAVPVAGGRRVALKILREPSGTTDPERRDRFLCEGAIAVGLRDPHLVAYLDVGANDGVLYMATELMTGGDTCGLQRRYPAGLPWMMVAEMGRDVALGLVAMHAQGLLHRDVKPGNLFLDRRGLVKLGDFGLVRHMRDSTSLTNAGSVVGTPDFMAPEQARGIAGLDARADLYGLAATLFWLATGTTVHPGTTVWGVLTALVTEPFPDPRSRRPDLHQGLARILRVAGDKDRDRRHPDAATLARDFEDVLAGRVPGFAAREGTLDDHERILGGSGPRIALIDDDPLVRRIYATRLMMDGFQVEQAVDGAAARRLARAAPPAAVLLDLMLPDADGVDLLRELRADAAWRMVPIIVLSNAFDEERLRRAQEAGATRVMGKGGTGPQAVSALLRELLARPLEGTRGEDPAVEQAGLACTVLDRVQQLVGTLGEGTRRARGLEELAVATHGLAGVAAAAGAGGAAILADATELFARRLQERPERLTASSIATVGQAVARLRLLLGGRTGRIAPLPWNGADALVVDDDRMALRLAQESLAKVRIRSSSTTDPADALARLDGQRFDLVVADVMMEGMDGRELIRRIRQHPAHRHVPVVFVTAIEDFAAHHHLDPVAGDDAIAKPYQLIELALKGLVHLLRPAVAIGPGTPA